MFDTHRYRGRHRAPSTTGRAAARVGVVGVVATTPLALTGTADAAPDPLGAIERCESGGNATAKNPSSSASGRFQIINGTWAAYGGQAFAATARLATSAEQEIVARRILAAEGTRPWNASRSCWSGKAPAVAAAPRAVAHRATPPRAATTTTARRAERTVKRAETARKVRVAAPTAKAPSSRYTVRAGDTLTRIAARRGADWHRLYAANRGVVGADPNLILPGQRLTV